MSKPAEADEAADVQRRRARQRGRSRSCRVAISVDSAELAELEQGAREEGLTVSAFVAEQALAGARHTPLPNAGLLREVLADLVRATVQVQKVGTNLNQAIAALNSTGEAPENLLQYARYAVAVIGRLDRIAAEVSRHLP